MWVSCPVISEGFGNSFPASHSQSSCLVNCPKVEHDERGKAVFWVSSDGENEREASISRRQVSCADHKGKSNWVDSLPPPYPMSSAEILGSICIYGGFF